MDKRVRALAAAAAMVGGLLAGPVFPGARAEAAPVTLAGCGPSSGATDTGGLQITIDDAAFAGGAMVALHDRTGGVTYPAPTDSAMSSPMCGVQRLADGSYRYEWLYCTDPVLNTCATDPLVRKGLDATGVGSLSDLDKARLAWLLEARVDNATAATRIISQRLVWCVTEGVAANAPAPEYFKNGTDVALSCPDWAAIDPTLDPNPTVAVAGPAAPLTVGATARFDVTTDVTDVDLGATGLADMALCPGTTGATLSGTRLTIAAPAAGGTTVGVCATGAAAGTGTLTATIAARTARTLEFWQREANTQFCQGMLSAETLATAGAQASATAVFTAAEVTTTTAAATTTTTVAGATTTVAATTTTTDGTQIGGGSTTTVPTISGGGISPGGTLPRTGAQGSNATIGWALLLVGVGVLLVSAGRRPARR